MLTYSSLSDKHVGALCSALRSCTLLASLSLSYNGLESQGVAELSHSLLPHLRALTFLDLSHNGCGGWAHNAYSAARSLPPHLQVGALLHSDVLRFCLLGPLMSSVSAF
jgi:hypothetical protein